MKAFGPSGQLLGAINDAAAERSDLGGILWSMSLADKRIARHLGRYGVPTLQVRFETREKRREAYNGTPIAYCRAAMDKLASERGVGSFLLIGNCGYANICLKTALADDRVTGLIMTNPYLAGRDSRSVHRSYFSRKLRKLENWKRFLSGRTSLRQNLIDVGRLFGGRLKASAESAWIGDRPPLSLKAIAAPADVDAALRALGERGVRTLVACSEGDVSYHHLRTVHRKSLRNLEAGGLLRFVGIPSDAHNLSAGEQSGQLLYEAVTGWVDNDFLPSRPAPAH